MVLTKKPEETVTVRISEPTGDVRLSRRSMSFSTTNWNTPQSVRVSLAEDEDASDDPVVNLEHTVTSNDSAYDDIPVAGVEVTPKDDDAYGITVTPTSLTVPAGTSGTYGVKLDSKPTGTVRVEVMAVPEDLVTVSGAPLIFTTSNWKTVQTVTVAVDEDAGADEEQTVTLTHLVSGGDYPGPDAEIPFVTVTIPVEGVPSAPRGLSAAAGDERVTLSWSAPSSDGGSAVTRYEYRYRESGGSYGGWTTVSGGASATSQNVTRLDNGTTYEFQVRARNAFGPGPESNEARATLDESAPGSPRGPEGDRRRRKRHAKLERP